MALTVSRTCSLRLRLSTTSSPAFAACTQTWRVASRTYATESAVLTSRRVGSPSAKATHKSTNVSSASPKKVSAKVERQAAGHGKGAAVEAKALAGSSKSKTEAAGTSAKKGRIVQSSANAEATKKLNIEEQQLQELEAIEYFKKVMKSADPFGQPIATSLDVLVPRPAGFSQISKYSTLKEWWKQALSNRLNSAKNFMSLLYLAADDAIPGVKLGRVPWYKSFGWLFKAGGTNSIKDNVWVSPLRQIALDTYRQVNQNVAKGDIKAVKTFSAADFQEELLRRVKKQPPNLTFKWNLEREVSPTQIVSLRVTQYYMGKDDPKFGSRYLTHALVKFDTEQTLEIYGPRGEPLHEVPEGAEKRADGTIAAKPKRVTEYLVLEKRMWYDIPWVFREQRWNA